MALVLLHGCQLFSRLTLEQLGYFRHLRLLGTFLFLVCWLWRMAAQV
jgi:hypothetical protein